MAAAPQKTYKTGEVLFREGDPATSLFLVLHGRISIRKSAGDTAVEIGQVGPNQIVGELAFFDRKPRSADAIALAPTEVAEVPFAVLDPIYNPAPDYLKRIMISLATRLREADETIKELKEQLGINVPATPAVKQEGSEIERVLAMTSDKKDPEEK